MNVPGKSMRQSDPMGSDGSRSHDGIGRVPPPGCAPSPRPLVTQYKMRVCQRSYAIAEGAYSALKRDGPPRPLSPRPPSARTRSARRVLRVLCCWHEPHPTHVLLLLL